MENNHNVTSGVFGLFGAGGFGREVMPFAKASLNTQGFSVSDIFFVEDKPSKSIINNYDVISESDFFSIPNNLKLFNVTIANASLREQISKYCIEGGATPAPLISKNTEIYDCNFIGLAPIICGFVSITSNVKIGDFFHANIYSYVAHDCVIGNYVTFAPNVHCNGNVHIGDFAYIGAGAVIKPGSRDKPLTIGKGAIVGMGAVVTKDVPPFTTVIGNPARPLI